MTTEALVPAAAEPAVVTAGGGEIVLPQVIVDAGPAGGGEVPGVLRGADREREDAGGVRAGGGAVSGVVRGARPPAARHLPAPCGRLHPDPPRVGPHGEAAPGRDRTHRSDLTGLFKVEPAAAEGPSSITGGGHP